MSAVGVLAALDAAMRDMPSSMTKRGHHGGLSDARAAVAELIEAAEAGCEYLTGKKAAALRAALARVGGAA